VLVRVWADESCLGNGRDGATPGGAGGLVEVVRGEGVVRRDFWIAEPDTTNNRMAIRSAIEALSALSKPCEVEFTSDSQYLVKGGNEWLRGWLAKGKLRPGGDIKNPDLWLELAALLEVHRVRFVWVRGHDGHLQNEYANHLATRAAREQTNSGGLIASCYDAWLAGEGARFAP
jgi:ribonuclease HI